MDCAHDRSNAHKMSSDKLLVLKVSCDEVTKKVPLRNEEITFEEFLIMMQRVFKREFPANGTVVVKYMDEEKDWITISDTDEFSFAISSCDSLKFIIESKTLFLKLAEKNAPVCGDLAGRMAKDFILLRDSLADLINKLNEISGSVSGEPSKVTFNKSLTPQKIDSAITLQPQSNQVDQMSNQPLQNLQPPLNLSSPSYLEQSQYEQPRQTYVQPTHRPTSQPRNLMVQRPMYQPEMASQTSIPAQQGYDQTRMRYSAPPNARISSRQEVGPQISEMDNPNYRPQSSTLPGYGYTRAPGPNYYVSAETQQFPPPSQQPRQPIMGSVPAASQQALSRPPHTAPPQGSSMYQGPPQYRPPQHPTQPPPQYPYMPSDNRPQN
ncbi:hypothetical protein MXB_42 [Myxobolus squamalis]|nr:hypothetical protein MXB_42 [Myxobolus squamalis]